MFLSLRNFYLIWDDYKEGYKLYQFSDQCNEIADTQFIAVRLLRVGEFFNHHSPALPLNLGCQNSIFCLKTHNIHLIYGIKMPMITVNSPYPHEISSYPPKLPWKMSLDNIKKIINYCACRIAAWITVLQISNDLVVSNWVKSPWEFLHLWISKYLLS